MALMSHQPARSPRPASTAHDGPDCPESTKHGLAALRRWDATSCSPWHMLERDPELWMEDGSCLVYLHGEGSSASTPSFRLPFSALLAAECFPFVERFLMTTGRRLRTAGDMERWSRLSRWRTVELHVPAPSTTDQGQAMRQHLAIRNFLAWVVKRPVVGEHLGSALAALLHSMREFRSGADDSVAALVDYLDHEGYLRLTDHPDHALAVLFLAESFHLRDLYVRAFVHCVGMRERLSASAEYHNISDASKRLIEQARKEMDARLEKTEATLRNLADEELSEAHLGIPPGIRAHLERFRSFLLSFYSVKFGYYPPPSFDAGLCRTMGDDFAALYELLKDHDYTSFEIVPSAAVGSICTLQLIQSLDQRNGFGALQHPMPLLPQLDTSGPARRIPWLRRGGKHKAGLRQLEHAALVKASNWKADVFRNDLVRAYRRFEEELVASPRRADRCEKVSLVDARKVRWILVYAMHQVLRQVNQRPAGVPDEGKAPYLLAAPVDSLPPWKGADEAGQPAPKQAGVAGSPDATGIEIEPDVDYFALTHKTPPSRGRRCSDPLGSDQSAPAFTRSSSLSRILSRRWTFRGPAKRFRQATTSTPPQQSTTTPKPVYQEIVVRGYGNGTKAVFWDAEIAPLTPAKGASRSASTASQSGSSASSALASTASPAETVASSITSPVAPCSDVSLDVAARHCSWSHQEVMGKAALPTGGISRPNSLARRHLSAAVEGYHCARSLGQYIEGGRSIVSGAAGITRRHTTPPTDTRRKVLESRRPALLPNAIVEEPCLLVRDSGDWTAMQSFLDGKTADVDVDADVLSTWEQYAELGGLKEM